MGKSNGFSLKTDELCFYVYRLNVFGIGFEALCWGHTWNTCPVWRLAWYTWPVRYPSLCILGGTCVLGRRIGECGLTECILNVESVQNAD